MNKRNIALVGNPNCGKTTIFNVLTGGKIKTGNWPGVTVEKREGEFKHKGETANIIDLPGIYSFSSGSEDEIIARDYVLSSEPSLIMNIVDATNLERNLYLTTQLIEMKVPIVLVVNMIDCAIKKCIKIDLKTLGKKLGIPVIGISAIKSDDTVLLKNFLVNHLDHPEISSAIISYPNEIETVIGNWSSQLTLCAQKMTLDSRWIAIKLLENNDSIRKQVVDNGDLTVEEINKKQTYIEQILEDSPDIICADYRYGFIHSIARTVIERKQTRRTISDIIDRFVLNRFLGIPIFFLIMYLIFWITITVGGAFIDFFDILSGTVFVEGLSALLNYLNFPEWLITFMANGIGAGIQTVSTFVPIIFFMFLMLSILEDSGYMARAAFVMDRFMRLLGLPGKAFVPLLVGFGCTVPAIMATRTLENRKERYLTVFMAPFMSCGARLPVYALFTATFFPQNGGLIVFSLYMSGIFFAVLTGLLLKKTLFINNSSYFVMELPPYHSPRPLHLLTHTWDRLKSFILRAGGVIIIVVTLLSVLNSIGTDGSIGNENTDKSVLASIGKTITPVFKPMGIEEKNWPATVGIFTGIFAKEAVVGTLNSLYVTITDSKIEDGHEEENFSFSNGVIAAFTSIPENLSAIFDGLSDPLGTGLIAETDAVAIAEEIGASSSTIGIMADFFSNKKQAYAYLIFILLYLPCVAALAAVIKETGYIFGILNAAYVTILAWSVATLFYQITAGHSPVFGLLPLLLMGSIFLVLKIMSKNNCLNFTNYQNEEGNL
ncbi:MAG: Fe(2+) transporter permease subunit FeoB [Spirochaetes bacterium]|nr:Fe(2+) transporter permease subunit FeoB [Spirochaetota bacterium]MBN2770377.1 Fe(2+) transporter permease subunit FeoB [Spirochaetota bacterium]